MNYIDFIACIGLLLFLRHFCMVMTCFADHIDQSFLDGTEICVFAVYGTDIPACGSEAGHTVKLRGIVRTIQQYGHFGNDGDSQAGFAEPVG